MVGMHLLRKEKRKIAGDKRPIGDPRYSGYRYLENWHNVVWAYNGLSTSDSRYYTARIWERIQSPQMFSRFGFLSTAPNSQLDKYFSARGGNYVPITSPTLGVDAAVKNAHADCDLDGISDIRIANPSITASLLESPIIRISVLLEVEALDGTVITGGNCRLATPDVNGHHVDVVVDLAYVTSENPGFGVLSGNIEGVFPVSGRSLHGYDCIFSVSTSKGQADGATYKKGL